MPLKWSTQEVEKPFCRGGAQNILVDAKHLRAFIMLRDWYAETMHFISLLRVCLEHYWAESQNVKPKIL